jgi:small subunit ribosomal protein S1
MSSKNKFKYDDIFGVELEESSSEMTGVMEHTKLAEVSSDQIVKGRVTGIAKDFVTIDIGFKAEGRIPVPEFMDRNGDINVKVGDELEVYVSTLDSKSGDIILSRAKATQIAAWDKLEKAFENKTTIHAHVTGIMKGGLSVDIDGVRAFMPASQSGAEYHSNLEDMAGTDVEVKVMNFSREQGNVVVSRRQAFDEEKKKLREQLIPKIKEGVVFKGRVRTLSDYGAFVDIGGMDGLVHITDLSWGRVKHPSEIVSSGQEVEVIVLKYEPEKERLTLGMKQLLNDPWKHIDHRYKSGDRVKGKVVGLTDFGAFIEIEPGVEGMIHVSELSWSGRVRKPSDVLKRGDIAEAVILDLDAEKKKIGLGLKQIGPNPWDELKSKYPVGTRVRGHIKNITDFGMFVNIGEEYDGLVRTSDITWDTKEKNPMKDYKNGQSIEAVVLDISVERQRVSLGMKQLSEDPWNLIPQRYPVGRLIEGHVVKVADFGVFVELEPSVEGLIHISQLSDERIKKIDPQHYKVGSPISCLVTAIDAKNKKISLSVRAAKDHEEKENIKAFSQQQGDVKVSLGAFLKDKLGW